MMVMEMGPWWPRVAWTVNRPKSGNCPGKIRVNLGRKDGEGLQGAAIGGWGLYGVWFGAELEGWGGEGTLHLGFSFIVGG